MDLKNLNSNESKSNFWNEKLFSNKTNNLVSHYIQKIKLFNRNYNYSFNNNIFLQNIKNENINKAFNMKKENPKKLNFTRKTRFSKLFQLLIKLFYKSFFLFN